MLKYHFDIELSYKKCYLKQKKKAKIDPVVLSNVHCKLENRYTGEQVEMHNGDYHTGKWRHCIICISAPD